MFSRKPRPVLEKKPEFERFEAHITLNCTFTIVGVTKLGECFVIERNVTLPQLMKSWRCVSNYRTLYAR